MIRSSTWSRGSSGTLSRSAVTICVDRSSGRIDTSDPLAARPIGLRAVATMTASVMRPAYRRSVGGSRARRLRWHTAARHDRHPARRDRCRRHRRAHLSRTRRRQGAGGDHRRGSRHLLHQHEAGLQTTLVPNAGYELFMFDMIGLKGLSERAAPSAATDPRRTGRLSGDQGPWHRRGRRHGRLSVGSGDGRARGWRGCPSLIHESNADARPGQRLHRAADAAHRDRLRAHPPASAQARRRAHRRHAAAPGGGTTSTGRRCASRHDSPSG